MTIETTLTVADAMRVIDELFTKLRAALDEGPPEDRAFAVHYLQELVTEMRGRIERP